MTLAAQRMRRDGDGERLAFARPQRVGASDAGLFLEGRAQVATVMPNAAHRALVEIEARVPA